MAAYVVAVPSRERAELLKNKTLTMLRQGGVDPKRIYVFVASAAERDAYRRVLAPGSYRELVVGVPGIVKQRQFISKYFPQGTAILSVDDDISEMQTLAPAPKAKAGGGGGGGEQPAAAPKLRRLKRVHDFIVRGFDQCRAKKLSLWGVYPVNNAFFMKPSVSEGLKFICGNFHGFINRKDVNPTIPWKEDVQRSIMHFLKDGGVLRFNGVTPNTRMGANWPADQVQERMKAHRDAASALAAKYPNLGSVMVRSSSQRAEFRLKNLPRGAAPK